MYSFKLLIAFFVSAVLVSKLNAARLSCHCGSESTTSSSSESEEENTETSTAQTTTVVEDITCLSNCPSTTLRNPVCGTDGVTYPSLDALECAQSCGVDVDLVSNQPCRSSTFQPFPL